MDRGGSLTSLDGPLMPVTPTTTGHPPTRDPRPLLVRAVITAASRNGGKSINARTEIRCVLIGLLCIDACLKAETTVGFACIARFLVVLLR